MSANYPSLGPKLFVAFPTEERVASEFTDMLVGSWVLLSELGAEQRINPSPSTPLDLPVLAPSWPPQSFFAMCTS
jgi:hypothetical protein